MKVCIRIADGSRIAARFPRDVEDPKRVIVDKCPACGAEPAEVAGNDITHHDRDTYYAPAFAFCCGETIGEMETTMNTIFGLDEDEAVLVHGRCRVY